MHGLTGLIAVKNVLMLWDNYDLRHGKPIGRLLILDVSHKIALVGCLHPATRVWVTSALCSYSDTCSA